GRRTVVGDRPAAPPARTADADAETQELGRSERLGNRPQTVVPGQAAAEARLQPALPEVDVVVDDEHGLGRRLEEAGRRSDRAAGLVHVGLRLEQPQPQSVEADLSKPAREL